MTAAAAEKPQAAFKTVNELVEHLGRTGCSVNQVEALKALADKYKSRTPAGLLAVMERDPEWTRSGTTARTGRLLQGDGYQLPADAAATDDTVKALRQRVKELEELNRDLQGQVERYSGEATVLRQQYNDLLNQRHPLLTGAHGPVALAESAGETPGVQPPKMGR